MKNKGKTIATLFAVFLKIGAFTFGGGYAMIPLIQREIVEKKKWISDQDILNIVAIAESTPGPIAINSATFVGIQIAGIPGALVATFGCVLPSCVIVMTLAYVYYRFRGLSIIQGILSGLRPAVVAMIASAGIGLFSMSMYGSRSFPADLTSIRLLPLGIFAVGFFVLRKWKPSPILVMASSGLAGILLGLL